MCFVAVKIDPERTEVIVDPAVDEDETEVSWVNREVG